MKAIPPAPRGRPRILGPRDPGDAWVHAPSGERYWGRFGAAGLLALDPERGVLLQHRASWSHFGDTWGLPGGARHQGESARQAALREASEEAGVPTDAVRIRFMSVLDLGVWSYSTVVGDVTVGFDPVAGDAESHELAWVPVGEVGDLPLHPGFDAGWPRLLSLLGARPVVVVDAANVVGSIPDGWWKDRRGATERLISKVMLLASRGMAGEMLDLAADLWFPEWIVVVEGQARAVQACDSIDVVRADGSGDDAIAHEARRLVAAGRSVTVVTSDRALGQRVGQEGGRVRGAGWLRGMLPRDPRDA